MSLPFTLASAGFDHCPSMVSALGRSDCQAILPVFLLTATKLGAFGDTTLPLSPVPFPVTTSTRSPATSGEQLEQWYGTTFNSFIMSKRHWILPSVSAQTTSQVGVT